MTKIRHKYVGRLILGFALLCGVGAAGQTPQTVDTSTIGPKVGDRVPAFAGTDQFGKPHSLESALGANGAMLVFFRSADW